MSVVGRLREEVDLEQARARLESVLLQLREEHPNDYDDQISHTLVLQKDAGIHPSFAGAQVGLSTVLMVVVGLLLLIACVNVANLFMARARDRRREMGIRISMGAGRGRIVQQLLTESLIFSILAGLAGLGLAKVATGLLSNFRPPIDGPFQFNVELSPTVLLFTAAVSLSAGFVFGMAPALLAARSGTASALRGASSERSGGQTTRNTLIVAQVALSLLLLISSGLFLRSLQSATQIDPGFDDPGNLVMASVDPGLQGYDEAQAREFWDRITNEVERLPETTGVGLTLSAPLGLGGADRGVEIPGYDFAEGERSSLNFTYVSEGYLETMGIDLVQGRTFTRLDDEASAPVMIINQRFADRFWPDQSALGKTVVAARTEWEVVGVVETGKYRSLGEEPTEYMYFPYRRLFRSDMTLVARSPGDPQAVLRQFREIVRSVDPDMPVYDVRSMEDHMGIALLPARLGGSVLGLFGLLGLTLAAVGIYGVMAYSVSQRRRELGIRLALGADRGSVLRLVLNEGMRLALIGTALGVAAALGISRLVQGLLYNVNAMDPIAFTVVPTILIVVAAVAVYLPARRAAAVDPMLSLKMD